YSAKELTRETVLELIAQARSRGARTMPQLARLLRACDPAGSDADERKVFYRFKNFLYKTVRIT
ncbi:MAG: hypothetical protein D6794_09355, partial [Deltaproteobacteria bacterium]